MLSPPQSPVVLSLDQVREWIAERTQIDASIGVLEARGTEIDRKIEAAAVFLGEDAIKKLRAQTPESDDDEAEDAPDNFRAAMRRIINTAEEGIAYDALRAELRANPLFTQRLTRTPQYFYTALGRLVARDGYVKKASRVFTKDAYQRFRSKQILSSESLNLEQNS